MKKLSKILSVGLSLALCANMVAPALAATFSELQSAIDTGESVYNDEGGLKIEASKDDTGAVNVKLHEDVTFDAETDKVSNFTVDYTNACFGYERHSNSTAGVVIDETVTIDLNGNTIDGNGKVGSVIQVTGDGNLTLEDSGEGGGVTGAAKSGGVYNKGGEFTMEGGSIEGNVSKTEYAAAGVTNEGGTFTMNGGTIKDNKGDNQFVDGGVYSHDGTFNMTGGSIEGNKGQQGGSTIGTGGVHNENGTFNMSGGAIVNNTAAQRSGAGGVQNDMGGVFNMSGGIIANNKASESSEGAGGVWNNYGGTFNMSGGSIENNLSEYHGGVLNGYSGLDGAPNGGKLPYTGVFHMSGDAKITGNVGLLQAGGVASRSGIFTMSGNASISGNMSLEGGGVTIRNQEMSMSDNATIEGNTGVAGGGALVHLATLNMSDSASIKNNSASKAAYAAAFENLKGKGWVEGDLAFLESRLDFENETGRGGGVFLVGLDEKGNEIEGASAVLNMSGNASLQGNKAGDIGDEICATEHTAVNVAKDSEWMLDNPESRLEGAEEKVFKGEELTAAVQDNTVQHVVEDIVSNSLKPATDKYPMTGLKFHKGEEPEIPDKPIPAPPETDTTVEIDDVDVPLAGIFTRADAIGYLWERTGSPEWELSDFPDVPEDHYWAVAIGWAQDMGIALPDEDGNFRPDDPVLRSVEDLEIDPEGELQEFLNRYAVFAGIELEDGELFIELAGNPYDIIMREEAEIIFNDFFAKLAAALAQAA